MPWQHQNQLRLSIMLTNHRVSLQSCACRSSPHVISHSRRIRSCSVSSAASEARSVLDERQGAADETCRRAFLSNSALLAAAACWQLPAQAAGQSGAVGDKLPKIGDSDLVEFIPDSKKTPSLRAGMIDSSKPYKFALPASWKEERVANIQSGNFCAPRCDEPWTEVIFQSPTEGKLQLIISPLRRLTSKASATIDQIGSPEGLLASIGPFITGTSAPDEEEVLSAKKVTQDGRLYYLYEANSQVGPTGPHILASCTTKDSAAYIFFVSASERQWGKSQAKLKQVIQTFRA